MSGDFSYYDPWWDQQLQRQYKSGKRGLAANREKGSVRPPEDSDFLSMPQGSPEGKKYKSLRDAGIQLLKKGKLGVLHLNGGLATRFGQIKATHEVGEFSGRPREIWPTMKPRRMAKTSRFNKMTLSANVRAYVLALIATGKPVVFYGTDLEKEGPENFMQGVVGVSAEEFSKPTVGLVSTKGVAAADTGMKVYTAVEQMFKAQRITPSKILWAAHEGDGAISMNKHKGIVKVVEAVGNVPFDAVLAMLETTTDTAVVAAAEKVMVQGGYTAAEAGKSWA